MAWTANMLSLKETVWWRRYVSQILKNDEAVVHNRTRHIERDLCIKLLRCCHSTRNLSTPQTLMEVSGGMMPWWDSWLLSIKVGRSRTELENHGKPINHKTSVFFLGGGRFGPNLDLRMFKDGSKMSPKYFFPDEPWVPWVVVLFVCVVFRAGCKLDCLQVVIQNDLHDL